LYVNSAPAVNKQIEYQTGTSLEWDQGEFWIKLGLKAAARDGLFRLAIGLGIGLVFDWSGHGF